MKFEPNIDKSQKWSLKQVFVQPEKKPLKKYLKFYTNINKASKDDEYEDNNKEVCKISCNLFTL